MGKPQLSGRVTLPEMARLPKFPRECGVVFTLLKVDSASQKTTDDLCLKTELQELVGISPRQYRRALSALAKAGMVVKRNKGGSKGVVDLVPIHDEVNWREALYAHRRKQSRRAEE